MVLQRVKLKFLQKVPLSLALLALASATASALGWLPGGLVEDWYARGVFPRISSAMGFLADAVPFSWLDLLIPAAVACVAYLGYRRKLFHILGLVGALYLFFFWTWGLNYHRPPLVTKLDFSAERVTEESVGAFVYEVAEELNALYLEKAAVRLDEQTLRLEADARVRRVVAELDGTSWVVGSRVKSSWLLNPFFRAAGVEGMFNPFGHEALVTAGLLPFERPMVMLHEMAHVRGYPNEGDANFVALMGAVNSSRSTFRYSGWLSLWFYVRSSDLDVLLDEGPRRDVEAVFIRLARQRVDWVSGAQTRTLDLFLKANRVEGGVHSYAQIVTMAVGTRPSWGRFSE